MIDGDGNQRAEPDSFSDALERILGGVPEIDDDEGPPTEELPAIVLATPDLEPEQDARPERDPAPTLPARAVAVPATTNAAVAPTTSTAATTPSEPPQPALAAAPPTPAAPVTTSWSDLVATSPGGTPLRAPGRRPRVRRVTRVVRHVDPWSTFKVALVFSAVGYLVALTSGVLLWRVAESTGTIDNIERWFTQFGWETFELKGGEIFQNAWVIGLFVAVGTTGGAVLLATLFNLVSDIVGGIRVSVLEEEVVERTASSSRRYVVRRAPPTQAWSVDEPAATPAPTPSSAPAAASVASTAHAGADWSVDD